MNKIRHKWHKDGQVIVVGAAPWPTYKLKTEAGDVGEVYVFYEDSYVFVVDWNPHYYTVEMYEPITQPENELGCIEPLIAGMWEDKKSLNLLPVNATKKAVKELRQLL